jgi:hypothetical protein
MPKGETAVTVCHQYGLHCFHGLFIGLLHSESLASRKHARGVDGPPILSEGGVRA